jgi:prolyl oligopeptidase
MYNFERYGVPMRHGNCWYYSYNEGLKAQNAYYAIDSVAIDTKEQGTVFFDPNILCKDGTLSVRPVLSPLIRS